MASLPKHKMGARDSMLVLLLFSGDKSPVCGTAGNLCLKLQLTPLLSSKTRMDTPSHVLFSGLGVKIHSQLLSDWGSIQLPLAYQVRVLPMRHAGGRLPCSACKRRETLDELYSSKM